MAAWYPWEKQREKEGWQSINKLIKNISMQDFRDIHVVSSSSSQRVGGNKVTNIDINNVIEE